MDALKLLAIFVVLQNKKMEYKTRISLAKKEKQAKRLKDMYNKHSAKARTAKARLVAELKRLMELDKGE